LSQRLQEMNDQLMKVEAHNRNLQLEIAEQQRLAEQARLTETETFQMAASSDDSEQVAKLQAAEAQLAELTEKCKEYEAKLAAPAPVVEAEPDVEVVSSATELQELSAKVAEKDEVISQLEAKVSELTSELANQQNNSSGQQSPTDLVVVTDGDLLGSEPLLTSESFEEVNPDKDYEGEVVEEVVVATESSEQESAPEVEQPEPEIVAVEVSTEESTPMEDPTEPLKAEIEKLKAEAETRVAEKQSEIDALQAKILAAESATPEPEPVAAPTANVDELMAQIAQLQESLTAKDAEIAAAKETSTAEAEDDGPTKDELKEQLKAVKDELQGRTEATDELKLKNNELREKNWKVIDALATAEKQVEDNKKSTNIRIIKGLKNIVPDFSIPKFEEDYELLFKEFGEKVKTVSVSSESTEMAEQVKTLTEEVTELKKTNEIMNASQDEILKSQQENVQLKEENAHIKNVLIETESMLCRLQTGVDAEVQKWQAKVTEKDAELDASKKSTDELKQILSKHGYDHDNLATLESSLSDGQKQLMAEKEENTKIKTELSELEKSLTEAKAALETKSKEAEESSAKTSNSEEVTELNSKLKKTISERDLLIREYKNVKDSNTKMESELKETKQSLETKEKEIEQMKTIAAATTTEPAVNGEKDATIQNEV